MAQHVRQGLAKTQPMLLYRADALRESVEEFLIGKCRVRHVQVVGDFRRRVEVLTNSRFLSTLMISRR